MRNRGRALCLTAIICVAGLAGMAMESRTLHAQPAAPRKRALLVGISSYERYSRTNAKSGAKRKLPESYDDLDGERDVELVKESLIKRFGFAPDDILVLTSDQATSKSIRDAFRNHLIAPTQPGDVVYFHFAGHGNQKKDQPNGDEVMDELDETLVPFDYVTQWDHSKDIVDDEIEGWLKKLSEKRPSNATLVFDCCHSGTVTRGRLRGRTGEDDPQASEAPAGSAPTSRAPVKGKAAADGTGPDGIFDSERAPTNIVVISACRNYQDAYQHPTIPNGLLTLALENAFRSCTEDTTYGDLMDRIESYILGVTPAQTPQIEGNPNLKVLASTAVPSESHFDVRFTKGQAPYVNAGLIHGATVGSEFKLYPADTKRFDRATSICTARAGEVTFTRSYLVFEQDQRPDDDRLEATRAMLTGREYGDNGLLICLDGVPESDPLAEEMKTNSLVKEIVPADGLWDLRISPTRTPGKSGYDVERPDRIVQEAASLGSVTGQIDREVHQKMIRSISNRDPEGLVQVDVKIVPVVPKRGRNGTITGIVRELKGATGPNGRPLLEPGSHFVVKARNRGSRPAHVTVMNISATGFIEPIYPHPHNSTVNYENNIVKSDGQWRTLGGEFLKGDRKADFVFGVTPAAKGPYTIKVFATSESCDFSPLLTRGSSKAIRGPGDKSIAMQPLERLLSAATTGTRSKSNVVSPANWATSETMYNVVAAGSAKQNVR